VKVEHDFSSSLLKEVDNTDSYPEGPLGQALVAWNDETNHRAARIDCVFQ